MLQRIRVELTAICLLAAVLVGCEPSDATVAQKAKTKGQQAAEQDIAQGILKEKEYPAMPYSLQEINYVKLMKEECGVQRELVRAPNDSKEIRAEVAGYNDVMHAEIRRRFGGDIIQKLRAKAEKR